MEGEKEYLRKIETKDGNFYLHVCEVSEENDEFDLNITDGCGMWTTRVTESLLQEMATKVEMNVKEFVLQTQRAISCPNSGNDCFIYEIVRRDSALEFIWKKQLDDGVKYQLGSISLSFEEENKELMQKILNFSIAKIEKYQDDTVSMRSEIEQLSKDRDNAISRLEKCVVNKEEMELDLFQKFVAVLNDKKAKIRRLQEAIEQQSKQPSTKDEDLDITHDRERDNLKKNNKGTGDESDQSQDDERPMDKQSPSTSSNIGSCLFKDEEDTGPAVKRRRKKQSNQPKTTPCKPVLPEVKTPAMKRTVSNASSDSTTSNESKQSGRGTRRSSRKKGNSSTFPDDVEDLFGDMA